MIAPLALEGQGGNWRLSLVGDWSLRSLARIEAQLEALPGALSGLLVCDWSRADNPGIGSVWSLLARLAGTGAAHLEVRHTGAPPHFLELLQKLAAQRTAARAEPRPPHSGPQGPLGEIGRWAVFQGIQMRGVVDFFGRIVSVVREMFSRPRAASVVIGAPHL